MYQNTLLVPLPQEIKALPFRIEIRNNSHSSYNNFTQQQQQQQRFTF